LKLLILSFYYEPDLSACSFRSTALVKSLSKKLDEDDEIEVITTMPNRYKSLRNLALPFEEIDNVKIHRIVLPDFKIIFIDQAIAFISYWIGVKKLIKNQDYDLIFVTSGRFFSAFLGATIAKNTKTPFYLDIRDILSDGITNVVKSKIVKFFLLPFIKSAEKFSVLSATHLNLVSKGFKDSFNFYKGKMTFFTNGIDNDFLENDFEKEFEIHHNKPKIITYAGNIGEGQGLEKIIPEAAKKLKGKYIFNIIGDGGTKHKLTKKLTDLQIDNVNLINPINRNELIRYYQNSDFLFLHLNNYEAFKKVLPSKIFEYGATEKPIIAGVDGYARKFINEHLEDALIFEPSNVEEFIEVLENYQPQLISRGDFIERFSREAIFDKMTDNILDLIHSRKTQLI
jgi:UDP-N-acetylglucosamine:LPS N-acetylglucosamine transferase